MERWRHRITKLNTVCVLDTDIDDLLFTKDNGHHKYNLEARTESIFRSKNGQHFYLYIKWGPKAEGADLLNKLSNISGIFGGEDLFLISKEEATEWLKTVNYDIEDLPLKRIPGDIV